MKVCTLTGWHSIYKSIINNPPKGVEYLIEHSNNYAYKKNFVGELKRTYYTLQSGFNKKPYKLLNKVYVTQVGNKEADMYFTSGVLLTDKKPWVNHLEHLAGLTSNNNINNKRYIAVLKKLISRDYCTYLLPMSKFAMRSFRKAFGNEFDYKTVVLYPVIESSKQKVKKTKSNNTRFLFVGSSNYELSFEMKGGADLLRAFNKLSKKYDAGLTIISRNISDKSMELTKKIKNITIYNDLVDHDFVINSIYPSNDVFVFPSYKDTFGYVCLEAKKFGLPLIVSDNGALPEFVENDKTGFIVNTGVNSPFIAAPIGTPEQCAVIQKFAESKKPLVEKELYDKMEFMINNPVKMKKMGEQGKLQVEKGIFSNSYFNKNILKIYKDSVERFGKA